MPTSPPPERGRAMDEYLNGPPKVGWFDRLAVWMFAAKPVRLTPDYALLPEIVIVGCGRAGARVLNQMKDHPHVSVYWPGRGEAYISGRPVARVTVLSEDAGRRLSYDERRMLRNRMITFGSQALWLED